MKTFMSIGVGGIVLAFSLSAFADSRTVSFSKAERQVVGLASSSSFELTLTAGADFPGGAVALSVDSSGLRAMDADGDVSVSVAPSSVSLSAGRKAQVKIKITTRDTVPSFAGGKFAVVAKPAATATPVLAEVALDVAPVLVITQKPRAPGQVTFSTDSVDEQGREVLGVTRLRKHPGGVTVRWVNLDTVAHIIHGQSGIPHQSNSMAPATVIPGQEPVPAKCGPARDRLSRIDDDASGCYEVTIIEPRAFTGVYYSHDVESGRRQRLIHFNSK